MDEGFRDRADAGRILGGYLAAYGGRRDVIVLALPRGGVPVAFEVAQALRAPLDVFLVRKLGVPGHEELAMGAIASGGIRVVNATIVRDLHIEEATLDAVGAREAEELARREATYRGGRPQPPIAGRVAILVDDGLATGATMRAAIAALRQKGPRRIVVAVPVAAAPTCDELRHEVDEIICVRAPATFYAVGLWYADFSPTTDAEIQSLLARAWNQEYTGGSPVSEL